MSVLRNLKQRADDRGVALPFIAVVLVLLLGMAAFAVDLGWIFLNGARVQRAADSAALFAINGAQANGYDIGTLQAGTSPPGPTGTLGPDTLAWESVADNKLEVTLDSSIETFFLKVLGFNSFDIKKVSTAEYIKPVPLGSPDPCFGMGSLSGVGDCSPSSPQNFWAAVSGPWTNKHNGDAYSTEWWSSSGWSPPEADNPQYRDPDADTYVGYYMAVDVPSGAGAVTVYIYDAGFYDRGSFSTETGDREQNSGGGADMEFRVWQFDESPLDPSDNKTLMPGCSFSIASGANPGLYKNQWRPLCTIPAGNPGLYVLQVWSTGNIGGTNQYSVRAQSANAPDARVYAINDMSIFTNQAGATSTLYLAEIIEDHAGKILELDFYDPGEDDANAFMTVQLPNGNTAQCTWYAEDEDGNIITGNTSFSDCRIQTSNGSPIFNGYWVHAEVQIPDPVCDTDCWFKMVIENSQPHDRTTWSARVIGNPVKLTPNQ